MNKENLKKYIDGEIENFIIFYCGSEEGIKENMKDVLKIYMGEIYE